jgi:hypothetical protein
MITQRAKWIRDSPSSPCRVEGMARAAMKRRRLTHVAEGVMGVMTFIP